MLSYPGCEVRFFTPLRSAPKTGLGNGDIVTRQEPTRGDENGGTFGAIPDCIPHPRVVCPLSPMAEAVDLKYTKYRFESDRGYKVRLGYLPAVPEGCIPLGTEVLVRNR